MVSVYNWSNWNLNPILPEVELLLFLGDGGHRTATSTKFLRVKHVKPPWHGFSRVRLLEVNSKTTMSIVFLVGQAQQHNVFCFFEFVIWLKTLLWINSHDLVVAGIGGMSCHFFKEVRGRVPALEWRNKSLQLQDPTKKIALKMNLHMFFLGGWEGFGNIPTCYFLRLYFENEWFFLFIFTPFALSIWEVVFHLWHLPKWILQIFQLEEFFQDE